MQDSDNDYMAQKAKSPKFFENQPKSHTIFLEQSTILDDQIFFNAKEQQKNELNQNSLLSIRDDSLQKNH